MVGLRKLLAVVPSIAVAAAMALPLGILNAQETAIDQAAVDTLQRMTRFMGGLEQFGVHTQVTYEDQLESGQRVDVDVSAEMLASRPDKFYGRRTGELLSQEFFYDGKSLTLMNSGAGVYATEAAPATIEGMLDLARDELNLFVPASDLVYANAFELLMEGVTSAIVVGNTEINGRVCQHLAFSRPDVDFQVWVEQGERPLPCKYVVTDTGTPAMLSVSTVMSDWNTAPAVPADMFSFTHPKGAHQIEFLPLDSASGH